MAPSGRWWLGIDVGGTFTDLVAVDRATGEVLDTKVLTTGPRQEDGVIQAIEKIGIPVEQIDEIVHGHTTGIKCPCSAAAGRARRCCGLHPGQGGPEGTHDQGFLSQDTRAVEPALRLIESRRYPLELMHTHTLGLSDIGRAVATLSGRVPGVEAIHVMLDPSLGR